MNLFCESAFRQINVLAQSICDIIDKLEDTDLARRPTENKHSIGELLKHIAMICEADLHISDEKKIEEMESYYSSKVFSSKEEIKQELMNNVQLLQERYAFYSEKELMQMTTSYWGVTYTRFDWLLEIVAHLYHHRGQLHAILVHYYKQDPNINLFE
ncbi:DinB family protein [Cytobacillus sp. IB215316]|uniref:DinB family protein n=1 Tax=Cytobacillus sp. IB215316 TaxID=3097354 RepID=UPI002A0FC5DD|nr:DinB family protein [Cytobacillus sp. IB215316]MDX8362623.1 DinB family protein [Cytobacillus sp. IB215316]